MDTPYGGYPAKRALSAMCLYSIVTVNMEFVQFNDKKKML